MKFVNSNHILPEKLTFSDVPVNRFFIDRDDELLFKYNPTKAMRIADKNWNFAGMELNPSDDWDVKEILPYDRVEF